MFRSGKCTRQSLKGKGGGRSAGSCREFPRVKRSIFVGFTPTTDLRLSCCYWGSPSPRSSNSKGFWTEGDLFYLWISSSSGVMFSRIPNIFKEKKNQPSNMIQLKLQINDTAAWSSKQNSLTLLVGFWCLWKIIFGDNSQWVMFEASIWSVLGQNTCCKVGEFPDAAGAEMDPPSSFILQAATIHLVRTPRTGNYSNETWASPHPFGATEIKMLLNDVVS